MHKYSDEELLELLNNIESDRVERKQSFESTTRKKAREAVCAFANDLPNHQNAGVLFIGVKDDGTPSGTPITDTLLCNLANMRSDGNILPLPTLSVEKRSINNNDVAVVTVMPSDMPPVKYEGRIWIRTGPRRSIANEQEERILNEKRRFKNLPFDIQPLPSATVEDLSKTIFENEYLPSAFAPDILEENGRTYEERLASCKMTVSPTDTTPTVLGLLAVGKRPLDFIQGAYVQFLRIDGTELSDPVTDEAKITGTIVEVIRRVDEKIQSHNRTSVDITSDARHITKSSYPIAAIRQILYNAVLHRTYEHTNTPVRVNWFTDRIEIISPGGPFGNVTENNFGQPGITDYRNPNIGDLLKTFGYVQEFGRGIVTAIREMERNGNPRPEFEVNKSVVVCTLRK